METRPIIMLSGGFDPIHPGHLDMIRKAHQYGDVWIILNSDAWLVRKKGFFFQSFEQRKAILEDLYYVGGVVAVDDTDGTVCKALEEYVPDYFGNGGDRKPDNTPEVEVCKRLGIDLVWNLDEPDTRAFHSSFFISKKRVEREWGYYDVLLDEPNFKIKKLVVYPGKSTSKQYHTKRTEYMFHRDALNPVVYYPYDEHRIENQGKDNLEIIEVQTGVCEEEDIVRLTSESDIVRL